jgi:toxin ParE1/3/4
VRGTRKLPLGRFPYTLVYRIDGDTVRVLAFMHQSRKPEYWLRRR